MLGQMIINKLLFSPYVFMNLLSRGITVFGGALLNSIIISTVDNFPFRRATTLEW